MPIQIKTNRHNSDLDRTEISASVELKPPAHMFVSQRPLTATYEKHVQYMTIKHENVLGKYPLKQYPKKCLLGRPSLKIKNLKIKRWYNIIQLPD